MTLPWQDIPSETLPDLPSAVNPDYMVLRAVQWNESLNDDQYAKPYTEKTLAKILNGDAFAAAQFEKDPIKRLRRIRRLESSPFYNVLQGIRGGEKAIVAIVRRLEQMGLIQQQSISFPSGDGAVTYTAPILSQAGTAQVVSGKYF